MELKVIKRDIKGKKVKLLREEWLIPAVIYGKTMNEAIKISCNKNDFVRLYKKAWWNTPITLEWEGISQMVLIHDYQLDPIYDIVLHVDFLAIKKWESVETDVPLNIVWEAPIDKSWDGRVEQIKDTITISAKPKDLPKELTYDISNIKTTHEVVFVKDIELPTGVELKDDWDIAVITVASLSWTNDIEESEWTEENAAWTAGVENDTEKKTD